ncbi:MAG: carboxypeptidase regulatory-like domain-containing protein [Myxococcales bacterium]|nr:carboxypeptidase regulatory-like domain-containing protein [Myxococcales bacterium]
MQHPFRIAAAAAVIVVVALVSHRLGWWGARARPTPPPAARLAAPGPDATAAPRSTAPDRTVTARDDDPRGPLRLEGVVLDGDDHGVAGAIVALDSTPPRTVATDTDGSFAFDGLIARAYRVEASADDRHGGPVQLRLTATSDPVTLRLAPAGVVEVTVRAAADGAPVAGATVELRGTLLSAATAGADGVATMRGVGPTWGALHVAAAGFAPSSTMVSTAGDPATPARFAITLARGAAVSGRVVDEAGAAVAGARVVATSASEPFPVTDPRKDGVISAADGTFTVAALAAGSYRLTVTDGSHAEAATTPFGGDGASPRRGLTIVMGAGGVVRGSVTDATGAPVAGADVSVVTRGHVFWRPRRQAFTDSDGRFAIGGLPRRGLDVVAWHPTGASAVVAADLTATATVELALTLDVTGAITGVVVDRAGEPIGDAQVLAEAIGGGPAEQSAWSVRGTQQVVTDPGGSFRFAGLPAGDYRVRAARGDAGEEAVYAAAASTAQPGGPPLRLVLAADGHITGKVAFADGRAPALVTIAIDGASGRPTGRADGTFARAAIAGAHQVVVTGPGFVPKAVRDVAVEEGAATDLGTITVEAGRSISGRVLDGAGAPVAGATVAAGPLLTGGGAELYIENESPGARSTETDADGRFTLTGFGPRPLTVFAGKDGVGRAAAVAVPRGPDSVALDLVLAPVGALTGTITRSGQPLGETVVIANPAGSTGANFFVVTGADGTFALDALSPGPYLIYPMVGGGGGRPKDMYMRMVDVTAGARAEVTIDASPGAARVDVVVATDTGAPVVMAQVVMVQAAVDAVNIDQLRDGSWMPPALTAGATIALHLRVALKGEATIVGAAAGAYTACGVPLPVKTPADAMALIDDAGALPMKCVPVQVAGAGRQRVDITVPAAWVTPR